MVTPTFVGSVFAAERHPIQKCVMKENYEWDGGGSLTKRVIGVVPGNTKVNARHYLCNLSLPSILLLIFSFHWFLISFFSFFSVRSLLPSLVSG